MNRFAPIVGAIALTLSLSGCARDGGVSGGGAVRTWGDVKASGVLRWGGDETGGAPYEFRSPEDPEKLVGFEVEIADELAKRLGLKAEFVQTNWPQLMPALQRGNFDVAIAGIEVTPERRGAVDFTRPYYIFTEQLVVRADDANTSSLDDMKGRKVGTLAATAAERVLREKGTIEVSVYDDNIAPYKDLELGRIDGVLLDMPLSVHNAKSNPKLRFAGAPVAPGEYAMAVDKRSAGLRDELDRALAAMVADGTLRRIYEKWGLWNDAQGKL